jgi:hypothetical protein
MMTTLSAVVGLLMLAQLTPPQVLPPDKLVLVYLSVTPLKPSPDLDRREKLQARAEQFFREELGRKRKILKVVDTPERADVSLELGEVFALTDGFFEASIGFTLGRHTETLFRASASIPDLGTNLGLAAEEWIDAHQSH